jgi:pSer/pThr/pTyr-binding forkhead associated (FHA) protein
MVKVGGARRALIVATGDYTDPGLKRLRAPGSNAEALAAVLREPVIGGFEVLALVNKPAHEVNLAVEEFFADCQTDDLLLVYLSGHAVKDEHGELYFATADTRLRRLGATAVAAEFVNRRMDRSHSRRAVLLLDCTYVSAFDRGMTARVGEGVGIEAQFGGRGRVVITASSTMEYAFEGDQPADTRELAPSVFTSALVEGLQTGDADRDQDGLVTLDELYDYVYDKVRAATPGQTPGKWAFGVQGELVIARRSRPVATPAPLLPELQEAIDSPLASVRATAVQELARVLHGTDAGRALAARLALERLTNDDSRTVAAAATAELGPQPQPPSPPPTPLVLDKDVQFSVYRPARLTAARWEHMLVYAHKGGPVMDPVSGLMNTPEEVEARARAHFRDVEADMSRVDAQSALARGARLRIVPELPQITCIPPAADIVWLEAIHEAQFQLYAEPELAGSVVEGWVRVWCGPLIIAEVKIAIPVMSADMPHVPVSAGFTQQFTRYRKIFPSYSHLDARVVEPFAIAARAIGDEYLQDVLELHPGDKWRDRLRDFIKGAQVFQLFWSTNSMRSAHCRWEWEQALALDKPGFICPIYWEVPMPPVPDALSDLHFALIPVAGPPSDIGEPDLILLAPDSDRGRRIPLDREYLVVGRESACDVVLDDPHVSRTHAALLRRGNLVYVQDLGSSAGTFVNGTPVVRTELHELHAGDVIAFAAVHARFEAAPPASEETRAMPAQAESAQDRPQQDRPVPNGPPRYSIGQQNAQVISNVGRDQYNVHVQQVIQQRDSLMRHMTATKTKARRLVWTGLLTFAIGFGLIAAADLSSFAHEIVGTPFWLVSWALTALGMMLLIAGAVLHIVATSRRRRIERELPLPPQQGAEGR